MFITLEGGEGSGKTTHAKKVMDYLENVGYKVILTREPGGTLIGLDIRQILLASKNTDLVPEAELLLYLSDRVQHVKQLINPALARGDVVICDRFIDSTDAYQGAARRLDLDLKGLHQLFNVPTPNLTLLFDLPPEVGLSRAKKRSDSGKSDKSQDRFEEEELDFHHRLREGYLCLAKNESNRFRIIDAELSKGEVWNQIKKRLDTFLNL